MASRAASANRPLGVPPLASVISVLAAAHQPYCLTYAPKLIVRPPYLDQKPP